MAICSTNQTNNPSYIATCAAKYDSVEDRNALFKSLALTYPEVANFFQTLTTKNETEQLQYMTQIAPSLLGFNLVHERYSKDSTSSIKTEAAIMAYVASHRTEIAQTKKHWESGQTRHILSVEDQDTVKAARARIESNWAPRGR